MREIKGMEEVETDFDKLREMMKRKVIKLHGINKLRNETKMILNEEEDFEVKHELVLLKKKQIELEKKVTEEEITFDQSIDQTQFKHHGSETKDNSEKEYKDMKQKIKDCIFKESENKTMTNLITNILNKLNLDNKKFYNKKKSDSEI